MKINTNIIDQGRREMFMIASGLILVSVGLLAYELINIISPLDSGNFLAALASKTRVVLQAIDTILVTVVLLGSFRGWPGRWLTFALLFLTAFLQFYMAGSRIGGIVEDQLQNVGLGSWMAIAAALFFMGTAFFWAWSTPLGAYLTYKRETFLRVRSGGKIEKNMFS